MLECACYCDGDSEGAFAQWDTDKDGKYHKCCECGETIWPWEKHRIGLWWDCSACDDFSEYTSCERLMNDECKENCEPCLDELPSCNDAMEDGYCVKEKDPTTEDHMCSTCANVVDQLLCRCWWVGQVWERVAEYNEMSIKDCLGDRKGS